MPAPAERWFRKLLQLLFAIFCFEMGLFLVLFPWFGHWEINYFAWLSPSSAAALDNAQRWRAIWLSPYFRGAVSGLGLVNIYIALTEVFRLKRFSPATPPSASPRVSIE